MDASAPVILEVGIVLLLAVAAGWAMRRLGLPAVIAYLGVGLLVSPFTPGYVADRQELQVFADVGVVLLLFEVGIEIDPLSLGRTQRRLLWIVPLHTVAVAGVAAAVGMIAGVGWQGASIVGVALALSSGAARERLLPFRDVFAVLFFVAVGSLIDPRGIPSALGWIALVLALVLVVKGGSIYGLARVLRLLDVSS